MGRTTKLLSVAVAAALATMAATQELPPEKRAGAVGAVPGALRFDRPPHAAFADVHQHEVLRHELAVVNHASQPVLVTDGISISPGGSVEVEPRLIPPGGSARVRVLQDVGSSLGRAAFRYALVTDEPGVSRYRFSLSGFVESAYDPEQPRLDLGRVERGAGGSATAELASREVDRLELVEADGLPAGLTLTHERTGVAGEALRLRARLAPGAPLGVLAGDLELRTNVPSQSLVVVPYRAVVFGDVVPSEHPLAFGLVRVGQTASREVRLESRGGRPFRVERLTDRDGLATTRFEPCHGEGPAPCWRLTVAVTPTTAERFGGTLEAHLAGDPEPLPLVYSGVAIAPDTVVRDLGVVGGDPADAGPP